MKKQRQKSGDRSQTLQARDLASARGGDLIDPNLGDSIGAGGIARALEPRAQQD